MRVPECSDHYHLVVYIDQQRAKQLSMREVAERWTQLFAAPPVVARWLNRTALKAEHQLAEALIEKWRELPGDTHRFTVRLPQATS